VEERLVAHSFLVSSLQRTAGYYESIRTASKLFLGAVCLLRGFDRWIRHQDAVASKPVRGILERRTFTVCEICAHFLYFIQRWRAMMMIC